MINIMFAKIVLFWIRFNPLKNPSTFTLHLSPVGGFTQLPKLGAGFTIIELLVVITMVGLVSGVGMFSLVNYGNTQSLEQTASNVKGVFDEAKFNSLSAVVRDKDANGNSITCIGNLSSYKVDIISSSVEQDRVELFMECGSSTSLVKTYTFPENINIWVDTTCDEVEYEAVSLEASALPLLPCVVSIEGYGMTKTLTIDAFGNLNVQ